MALFQKLQRKVLVAQCRDDLEQLNEEMAEVAAACELDVEAGRRHAHVLARLAYARAERRLARAEKLGADAVAVEGLREKLSEFDWENFDWEGFIEMLVGIIQAIIELFSMF